MATTQADIREWLAEARSAGATHMLVVCDTFDHEDYPSNVMPGQDPRAVAAAVGEMQRVMECYAMHLDLEAQLAEGCAFHYEAAPPEAERVPGVLTGSEDAPAPFARERLAGLGIPTSLTRQDATKLTKGALGLIAPRGVGR